jgi:hypothetical protein
MLHEDGSFPVSPRSDNGRDPVATCEDIEVALFPPVAVIQGEALIL